MKKKNTIKDKILRRIRAKRRGWVFTPKDFLDIAKQTTVNQTLTRLVMAGIIRRVDRGIYDFPKKSKYVKSVPPDSRDIADIYRKRSHRTVGRLYPSGAYAANLLGLSTQVPAKTIYMTNGGTKQYPYGKGTITFKHASIPIYDDVTYTLNLIMQAYDSLGRHNISDQILYRTCRHLTDTDIQNIASLIPRVPYWMAQCLTQLQKTYHARICSAAS